MELADYLKILRAHWRGVLAITILGAISAMLWAYAQPKVYTATASAQILAGVSSDLGSAFTGDSVAKARAKGYRELATSRRVAQRAIDALGLNVSPQSLVGKVEVTNPIDTAVLRVSADGDTPQAAQALAEAWIAGMKVEIETLENPGGIPDPNDPNAAPASVIRFQTLDSAVLPTSPSFPNTRLSVALGVIMGLILGVAYAMVRNILDRRIRTSAAIEDAFNLPVVGVIPYDAALARVDAAARDRRTHGDTDRAHAEAVRQLRTNIQFMNVDNPPRVVVMTSALPGDGKTTMIVHLAEMIAETGRRVVLVDADLRRPAVTRSFGLLPGVGLTDVLVGRAYLEDVLQAYGETGNLFVLGAGVVPPNPSELLGSQAMHDLLYSLDEDAMVLVDTPPLVPFTDAAILTARTDGALVVVKSGHTTLDLLDRALANLDRVNGRALGIILNGVPRRGGGGDTYSYDYNDYYAKEPAPERRRWRLKSARQDA